MTEAWILDPAFVAPLRSVTIRRKGLDRFGEAAELDCPLPGVRIPASVHPDAAREWARCLAEEALLRAQVAGLGPDVLANDLATVHPFDSPSPALADVLGANGACVVLPLDGSDAGRDASLLHLWLLDRAFPSASDHRGRMDGLPQWMQSRLPGGSVFITTAKGAGSVPGQSWMLAAELALRALREPDHKYRLELARRWLVTGTTDGARVHWVKLGNKLDLATRRTWLFPIANIGELPQRFPLGGGYRLAQDIDSAWHHVTGHGTVEGAERALPSSVPEMHSFVSTAREPVLAAALLGVPGKITLWASKSFQPQAEDLQSMLKHLLPQVPFAPVERISSSSMLQVEEALRRRLEPALATGDRVLFNVTNGNRLMSFAANNLARLHPNLQLIYRDLDADPFLFTGIHYEGSQPTTEIFTGCTTREDIRWNVLFERRQNKEREPWQKLLERLWIQPENTNNNSF